MKRSRRRPREKTLDGLVSGHGVTSLSEMIDSTGNRMLWTDIMISAPWHGLYEDIINIVKYFKTKVAKTSLTK